MMLSKKITFTVLTLLALAFFSNKITAQSIYIDSLKLIYSEVTDDESRLKIACQLYIDTSPIDSTSAIPYIQEAKRIVAMNPSLNKGVYHVSLAYENYYDRDEDAIREELKIALEQDDLSIISKGHISRLKGLVLFKKRKFNNSKRLLLKAEEEYRQGNHYHGLGQVLVGLGNIARRTKKLDLGIEYNYKAIAQFEKTGEFSARLLPMHSIANMYLRQGNLDQSLTLLNEISTFMDVNDMSYPTFAAQVKNQKAIIYEQQGKNEEASKLKAEILQFSKDSIDDNANLDQNFSRANGKNAKKKIISTAKDWQAEINTLKVKQLETENQLNESKIFSQRLIVGIAIILAGLLGLYAFSIYRKNKLIKDQNKVIQSALSEKETLLKEIHHRVKNNLQVVSSLLRIQSNETNDPGAINALKEGQSRVQSMSLIHQSLYQKDNFTGIKMKDYMERLISSLFNTYNISEDDIQLKTSIADINLDIETVVPLGLIINELVTNALKYAFPKGRQGEINVSLIEGADQMILSVKDNGIGITSKQEDVNSDSFGYGLIDAFCNKLDGSMTIDNDNGTVVVIAIKDYIKI